MRLLSGFLLFAVVTSAPVLPAQEVASPPLRLSTYMTVDSVLSLAADADACNEAANVLKKLSISTVYMEVYRSGTTATPEQLQTVRDFLRENGFAVAGGIATVPGKGFGVPANAGLQWFNFQAPETQQALEQVMRQSAPLFDTFIVDDFLCSGDISEQSELARGNRDWPEYRRDLMVSVAQDVFLGPAKEANPNITMIIKYPQWYDLFHIFGYDVVREPKMFDGVYVGTETRGATTQRYGYVQPYEGFINYRWLAALSGAKIGGAWFDHGDCADYDFIDQAWQSVAAGAQELVFFHYGDLVQGHPDHQRLREQFPALAKLAVQVRENPVTGPVGYKPPHSDPGDERYIMDDIGMLGISLVPAPEFPEGATDIFLPTQAAADPDIAEKVDVARKSGRHIVMTPGFIAKASGGGEMPVWAGLAGPVTLQPLRAQAVLVNGQAQPVEHGLDLAADLKTDGAKVLLEAVVDGRNVPFLTSYAHGGSTISVINVRTFSQSDFDAVGEVLLAPRQLGLLSLPREWVDAIRAEFQSEPDWHFSAPARVSCQRFGNAGWLVQNYTAAPVKAVLSYTCAPEEDVLSNGVVILSERTVTIDLPPRQRAWVMQR